MGKGAEQPTPGQRPDCELDTMGGGMGGQVPDEGSSPAETLKQDTTTGSSKGQGRATSGFCLMSAIPGEQIEGF